MKTCIHCKQSKPIDDFYKHPQMADGRLGRCKTCHKSEINRVYNERMKDPVWREKEMDRQRAKEAKRRLEGKASKAKQESAKKWQSENPIKRKAHLKVWSAIACGKIHQMPCEKCGDEKAQAHHDDYSKPLDVRWLCRKHHMEHHVEMRRLERFTMDQINQPIQ